MEVGIFPAEEELSERVSDEMIGAIRARPSAVICLASGDTPKRAYELFVKKVNREQLPLEKVLFIGLDEWLGIEPENPGSCFYFFEERIVKPLQLAASQFYRYDALSPSPEMECLKMDELLEKRGGIDLMIVGIGMNGHIGFNEPGTSLENDSHVVALDETTKTVGQKYFRKQTAVKNGITLGLRQVLRARTLILMAAGEKKAGIIQKALQWPVSSDIPASVVRKHEQALVLLDRGAASRL